MSEVKHTPGPWIADFGATRIEIFGSDEHAVVAQIYKSSLSAGLAQKAVANARLIAAAPDLLSALIELMAVTPSKAPAADMIVGIESRHRAAIAHARAAIARATGASHE